MSIEMETHAEQVADGWKDGEGFVTVFQQGSGPRANPRGNFPSGPAIGERMPDVRCLDSHGKPFDLHQDRAGRKAIFMLQRSAVW